MQYVRSVVVICAMVVSSSAYGQDQYLEGIRSLAFPTKREDSERKSDGIKKRLAQRRKDRLQEYDLATSFANGRSSQLTQRIWEKIYYEANSDPAIRRTLNQTVAPQDQFNTLNWPTAAIVESDGSLALQLLPFLGKRADQKAIKASNEKIESMWKEIVSEINSGEVPQGDTLQRLGQEVHRLQTRVPSNRLSASSNRKVKRLSRVVERIPDARYRQKLHAYFLGFPFEGGNLREFVEHLRKYHIAPSPGSSGQQLLAELTDKMVRQAASRDGLSPATSEFGKD